jgi:hypothetical protein
VAEVRLVDLEVIKRYSLAVRRDTVPAEELLEALEASQAAVRAALGEAPPAARQTPARRAPRARAASGKDTAPAGEAAGAAPRPARKAASRRGGA